MNLNSRLLFFTVSSVSALFFAVFGLLCMLISLSEFLGQMVIEFLQRHGISLFLVGFGSLAVGIFLFITLWRQSWRRTYSIRTGTRAITVDPSLIETCIKAYWGKRYPSSDIPCRVWVKKDILQISADLPETPLANQKSLLTEMERELQEFLAETIGYQRRLHFFISFGK